MTDYNVNIRFPKEPTPPKRRRGRDIFWLLVAAALFSVPFGSSIVFAVLAASLVSIYLIATAR